jgi:iron complex transport system substrate-binding protein
MMYRVALVLGILASVGGSVTLRAKLQNQSRPAALPTRDCRRIVSMAPSVTETLFMLGLGDRVVGVTRYCTYPPEANRLPRIGGYYDPNFEAVVGLRPDLVVMLEEQELSLPGFRKLGIPTLVVSHKTIDGILASLRTIGEACGKGAEGQRIAEACRQRIDRIQQQTKSLPRPRVLFALDRTHGLGHLVDVYVPGEEGYFDRIIELAGGRNACREQGVRNPVISPEGIAWLNPEVIVDVVSREQLAEYGRAKIAADWNSMPQVDAVKHGRVFVFDQDYARIPGPRFVQLVVDLARALHPEQGDCPDSRASEDGTVPFAAGEERREKTHGK